MTFQKGNKLAIKRNLPLTEIQKQQIEKLISKGFGYKKIHNLTKISIWDIKKNGYKTRTKKDKLIRAKKDSFVNPSDIEAYCDMSDITTKSLCMANKHARILKFKGGYSIKLCILSSKNYTVIQLHKVKSRGETKKLWNSILLCAVGKFKKVCVDTNCKFNDSPLELVHCVKDNKTPYNQIVESKIGHLKKRIYANIQEIKTLPIDDAIEFIKELAEIQYENKVKIEVCCVA